MKLCFSTLGCPQWQWKEILSYAKDMGYNGVEVRGVGNELFCPNIPQLLPERIHETKETLRRLGLAIPVLSSQCCLHRRTDLERTMEDCRRYIDTAALLGAPYVRVLADRSAAPQGEVDSGLIIENAQALAAYAGQKGVCLLIESNGVFADSQRLARLLREIGSTHVAALWDINHPCRYYQESPERTFGNLGDFVKHVHIKDSVLLEGKTLYKITGQGDLPVKECVTLLEREGYEGHYSLEWLRRWEDSLEEPSLAFAMYARYMRSLQDASN